MSKLEQPAWSEASIPSHGSPSSLWNGRPPSTMDGDAVTTASTSNVSTPSRGLNSLDAKDIAANAPVFTPSPLLPQDGSAWSMPRTGSLTWANDLAPRPAAPAELVADAAGSSPSAIKRLAKQERSETMLAQPPSAAAKQAQPASSTAADADATSPNQSSSRIAKPAAPVPKRAPIRSATLDPSQLAGNRRSSSDDLDDAAAEDQELVAEMDSLSIVTNDAAPDAGPAPPQHDLASSGYHSPPAFVGMGHAHRASGSFPPPPFGPGEGFMHPASYLPGSGARSPDVYAHGYAGMGHMLPGMAPIDMSGYESYRTTPDPYAPTMPGRAIFASPGSQGSTPQSPSFGPAPLGPHINPMRNGEALFYPGVIPGFGPPPPMAGGMASPVRHVGPPGPSHFGFADARAAQLGQSPMIAPGMPMPMGGMMPPTSPPMPPSGPDSRQSPNLAQASPYSPVDHRRMGSAGSEPFGPPLLAMSPRPPFAMTGQAGPFVPGQPGMHGVIGGAPMHGSVMAWNGRFDHRRMPTGPGGMMGPVGAFGGSPVDMHFARNGPGFYGAPYAPGVGGGGGGAGGAATQTRSALLEEFRSRHSKNRKFELADIYGSVVEFSGDQHGSRFIQEKLDSASAEEKKTLFDEVLPHARQLMTDVFGNYVIQKMLEHGDDEQRAVLAREMEGNVLALSLGTYGCRVVQKAFDYIAPEQREKLAKELDGHIMQCVRDQNANHVVQKVIERVDAGEVGFIPEAFVGHVAGLASHCYSCRVLQRAFEHCTEAQARPLLDELHHEAYALMQHQYGNYVIQWVLQRGQPHDRAQVIAKIRGNVLTLSRHKFASNVIEEVIRTSSAADLEALVDEILTPKAVPSAGADGDAAQQTTKIAPAVLMMKDQFANYVLQRFLEKADAAQRARLVEAVQPSLLSARRLSSAHQTKHLVAIERLIESLAEQTATAETATAP